jgi:hypothetical protein
MLEIGDGFMLVGIDALFDSDYGPRPFFLFPGNKLF